MTAALVVGAVLALVVVAFVARPFLREPEPPSDDLVQRSEAERARLELVEPVAARRRLAEERARDERDDQEREQRSEHESGGHAAAAA